MVNVQVSKKEGGRVYEGFLKFPPMTEEKAGAMVSYHKSQGARIQRDGDNITIDYFTPIAELHARGRRYARRVR